MSSFAPSNLQTIRNGEVILTYIFDTDGKVGQSDIVVDLLTVDQYVRENSKLEKVLGGKFFWL